LRQILYVSAAAAPVGQADLDGILEASRRNNAREGVTGMLLYIDGGFLQILEGPDDAVARTYDRIATDKRHTALRTLVDQTTDARLFEGWSMGFDRPSPAQSDMFAITREALEQAVPPERARTIAVLLRTFYVVNARHAAS
jgi:hypothetical protein